MAIESHKFTVGQMLAFCREFKGVSLREVEKGTGLSNAFISQVENGKTGLSFDSAVKLCDYYGLSIEKLANIVRRN